MLYGPETGFPPIRRIRLNNVGSKIMKIKGVRNICAHCGSSALEYAGWTPGGFHYYFRCSNCHEYTEYYYSLKTQITIAAVTLLFFVILGVLTVGLDSPKTGIFYFLAVAILSAVICYKYRWSFVKVIPIDGLPDGRWIVPAPNRCLRLVIIAIVVIGFMIYAGLFLLNLSRQ